MGREPYGLKLGIINDELQLGNTDCSKFSNITCFPASCAYVSLLEKKLAIVSIFYPVYANTHEYIFFMFLAANVKLC